MPQLSTLKRTLVLGILLGALGTGVALVQAADHRDSAFLGNNPGLDIADVYSFLSPSDPGKLVLVMTVAGLQAPSDAGMVQFPANVVYQWKIDTNGDAVEDYVLQAFTAGSGSAQVMQFVGPAAPTRTGTTSRLLEDKVITVPVSFGATARTQSRSGMTVFAGLRDDPFFFDLAQFQAILGGQAGGFRNPGVDAFAGTNVLALVAEVPIAMFGGATQLGVWATVNLPSN
ncbi:MAG: DUF4331 family protein [Gemmatimonadales bacterium]|nr:DUF4331 family protein [Gemmatimonadales bacterium]